MLLLLSLKWAVIISAFMPTILGFVAQRQPIVVGPIPAENVPYPLQGLEMDENQRGDFSAARDETDHYKPQAPLIESEEYSMFGNEVDAPEKTLLKSLEDQIQEDQDIALKSAMLLKLLEDPSVDTMPLVYVEGEDQAQNSESSQLSLEKRSRYYRRYPWKRQNSRHRTYEADTRYLCVPSREDVFKLLVGLHENRNGNHQKTVSFCNRKRPAKAIFTNIRFLG